MLPPPLVLPANSIRQSSNNQNLMYANSDNGSRRGIIFKERNPAYMRTLEIRLPIYNNSHQLAKRMQ